MDTGGHSQEDWSQWLTPTLIGESYSAVRDTSEAAQKRHLADLRNGATGAVLIRRLKDYLKEILGEVKARLRSHSRYYWLHVSRRLGTFDLGSRIEQIKQAVPSDLDLYREGMSLYWLYRRFTLALLKYGKDGQDDMQILPPRMEGTGSYVVPVRVGSSDVFDCFAAWLLMSEYERVRYALKRAGKGGKLTWTDQGFHKFDVDLDADIWPLVHIFDRRTGGSGNILRFLGSWASIDAAHDFPLPDGKTYIQAPPGAGALPSHGGEFSLRGPTVLALVPNITGKVEKTRWPLGMGGFYEVPYPAWLFQWVKLDNLLPRLGLFRGVMRSYLRQMRRPQYEPEDFLLTLAALTRYQRDLSEQYPVRWTQLFLYGYSLWDDPHGILEREVMPRFSFLREMHLGSSDARMDRSRVLSVIEDLTWNDKKYGLIEMLSATPTDFIFRISADRWWVDWSLLQEVIMDFVNPLGRMEGALARFRGMEFEEALGWHMRSAETQLGVEVWWLGREQGVLKFAEGRQRDLDIGMVADSTLIVIDAKAHAIDRDLLLIGDPKKLEKRFVESLQPDLDQVDTLVERMAKEPIGRNFKIPRGTKQIVGIVCGTFPEWIPYHDGKWWLYDDTPRVCTPEELWDVIARIKAGDLPSSNVKLITWP